MGIVKTPGMGFVGIVPEEEPFIRSDGASFTHAYPGPGGEAIYYTFKIGRVLNPETGEPIHHYLIITKLDPRVEGFQPSDVDSTMVIPMTESAVYGLMSTLTALRTFMIPETSAMLSTMFESGHFQKH